MEGVFWGDWWLNIGQLELFENPVQSLWVSDGVLHII